MSADPRLQSISIPSHSIRSKPSPHVVYCVQVATPIRTWSVFHRFSDFVDLYSALSSSVGHGSSPPGTLPTKHLGGMLGLGGTFMRGSWLGGDSWKDEEEIRERKEGLERWLRGLLTTREERWRESRAFKEFLAIPVSSASTSKEAGGRAGGGTEFTSQSWLDEHSALVSMSREIRSLINKRDSLLNTSNGNTSEAHSKSVEAKTQLASLLSRIAILTKGIDQLATGNRPLAEGELRRRMDMVRRLQDDAEVMGKLAVASRSTSGGIRQGGGMGRREADPERRQALLGGGEGGDKGGSLSFKPPARVFGAAAAQQTQPQETSATRPLDNSGLLQLQQEYMNEQDTKLEGLSALLRRQKELGIEIGSELERHNELLDELSEEVDHTEGKMKRAGGMMNRLGS